MPQPETRGPSRPALEVDRPAADLPILVADRLESAAPVRLGLPRDRCRAPVDLRSALGRLGQRAPRGVVQRLARCSAGERFAGKRFLAVLSQRRARSHMGEVGIIHAAEVENALNSVKAAGRQNGPAECRP